jgi:ERCC4-related helicase
MEETLEIKARSLEDMNSAMKVLLNGREKDKYEVAERVTSNVEQLIQPYVRKLKTSKLDVSQEAWVDIIETNLQEITSPFLKNASTFNTYSPCSRVCNARRSLSARPTMPRDLQSFNRPSSAQRNSRPTVCVSRCS